jgi:hypothetical protein
MASSSSEEDDGDYAFGDTQMAESKRYPVHDCCEFEDAETLRVSRYFTAIFSSVDPSGRPLQLEGGGGKQRSASTLSRRGLPRPMADERRATDRLGVWILDIEFRVALHFFFYMYSYGPHLT